MTTPENQRRGEARKRLRPGANNRLLKLAAILTLIAAWTISAIAGSTSSRGQAPAASEKRLATAGTQADPTQRFDYLVREDYFAGLAGDQAALERAIKTCEEALAKNPKHAEALVWHGSGLMLRSRF